MIRKVDLVSYLPPFMAGYREVNIALAAEDPEFVLVWKGTDRALSNEFITTADEYGIARFEKILGVLPSRGDSLEVRRARVLSRWFVELPYTWRMLMKKLVMICGEGNFEVYIPRLGEYGFSLNIHIGQNEDPLLHEAWGMLEQYLPANLWYEVIGRVFLTRKGKVFIGSGRSSRVRVKANMKLSGAYVEKTIFTGLGIGTVIHARVSHGPER